MATRARRGERRAGSDTSDVSSRAVATGTPAATRARRAVGIVRLPSGPAPPSRARGCRPRGGPGAAGRQCGRARPARARTAGPPPTPARRRPTPGGGRTDGGRRDRAGHRRARRRAAGMRPAAPGRTAAWCRGRDRRRLTRAGAELVGELQDAADVGAPESVDRLVGVADDDQVAAVTGQSAEQLDLARVGVLVLVDEDVGEALAEVQQPPLGRRAGRSRGRSGPRSRPRPGRSRTSRYWSKKRAADCHGGQPMLGAEPVEVRRVDPALAGAVEEAADLGCEPPGSAGEREALRPRHRLRRVVQQVPHRHVALRRAEQLERIGEEVRAACGCASARTRSCGRSWPGRRRGCGRAAPRCGRAAARRPCARRSAPGSRPDPPRGASTRSTTLSTSVVVLPVPGPASTRAVRPRAARRQTGWRPASARRPAPGGVRSR